MHHERAVEGHRWLNMEAGASGRYERYADGVVMTRSFQCPGPAVPISADHPLDNIGRPEDEPASSNIRVDWDVLTIMLWPASVELARLDDQDDIHCWFSNSQGSSRGGCENEQRRELENILLTNPVQHDTVCVR